MLYSAPVRFSGSATDPELSHTLGLGTGSRYEGPTGMIGVLHDKLRRSELTSASLWANMPYYISVTPNPKGMLALVRRGLEIVGLPADFPDLEEETREFEERVAEAVSQDPKIAAHVRKLERQQERDESGSLLLPEGAVSGDDLARRVAALPARAARRPRRKRKTSRNGPYRTTCVFSRSTSSQSISYPRPGFSGRVDIPLVIHLDILHQRVLVGAAARETPRSSRSWGRPW